MDLELNLLLAQKNYIALLQTTQTILQQHADTYTEVTVIRFLEASAVVNGIDGIIAAFALCNQLAIELNSNICNWINNKLAYIWYTNYSIAVTLQQYEALTLVAPEQVYTFLQLIHKRIINEHNTVQAIQPLASTDIVSIENIIAQLQLYVQHHSSPLAKIALELLTLTHNNYSDPN
jgi:hypothetical protein